MFAVFCRRGLRLRVPPKDFAVAGQQFWSPKEAVSARSCSSTVCENASEKSFTVSYLINSCGLSSNDAISASKNLCFNSSEKPDAVLNTLRDYGFTDTHIPRIVRRWPKVLSACPNKTLLPKLKFFRSIGVPCPVLAQKLSVQPYVLTRSLENSIIPLYNDLKGILGSDERVVRVFTLAPKVFGWCWGEGVLSRISMLRERGVPQSAIDYLSVHQPMLLMANNEKLAANVDRAVEMGFDMSKSTFVQAIRVFGDLAESTLKQKMEVYRKCGLSESDIIAAFLRYPLCMTLSEKKIMATMDFLVNKLGCNPVAITECPVVLRYSLEKRIKPRGSVARILNDKGLKNMTSLIAFLSLPEEKFINQYIVRYEKDIPELSDIYRGKLNPPETCFSEGEATRVAVSFRSCSSSVRDNVSEKSFTIFSYLVNSCGLSSEDAISASKKLCCIKSPEKPDAVLKLLREYGFTDAHHIPRVITGWPAVLVACPNKTLFPKLEFFRSIGVPFPVLAQKLSVQPSVLTLSLENSIIPLYNHLKSILGSDERVVRVFVHAPKVFGWPWAEGVSSNLSMLRERGVPESTIVRLVMRQPTMLVIDKEKLAVYVDHAVAMGSDTSKITFPSAVRVCNDLTESTLEQKMEKEITANMEFLVNEFGYKPAAIAQCPVLLKLSLEKRIKPRCLVARILNGKGLWKKTTRGMNTLLKMSEEKFLKRYIVKYDKDIPELLDIYRGKLS
ncbi:hypothetical protein PHJA_002903300 [Phtheirospermum japonicum]|uniref:Mitochondrial transcription termination factor n=1 Tax=Phtheirospermum japonicum TaxID=374723 RepID=A0A830DPI0_9LAMI|nr:hypothetical protein PHJA_002903300 [Phtheirospermum japonicum]